MSPRNEQELLDQTVELAKLNRWAVMHQRPGRTISGWRTTIQGHAGFPDLVLCRDGLVLFRELKGPIGRLSQGQVEWARQISGDPDWREPRREWVASRTLALFDVWRPADFEPLIVPMLGARS